MAMLNHLVKRRAYYFAINNSFSGNQIPRVNVVKLYGIITIYVFGIERMLVLYSYGEIFDGRFVVTGGYLGDAEQYDDGHDLVEGLGVVGWLARVQHLYEFSHFFFWGEDGREVSVGIV